MFTSLTEQQEEIVFNREGRFVVRACPGSGKTYCVSARFAHKLHNWFPKYAGIAALSFTNVAWQQIEKKLGAQFSVQLPLSFPHFLGTIDSFINNHVFLPYGHMLMNPSKRPVLVGEPHGGWSGRSYPEKLFDKINIDIDGQLFFPHPRQKPGNEGTLEQAFRCKRRLLRSGYATQQDANYFALRILEEYPQVARSLVYRFPMLIVDEVQDTSEIQMRIIDKLIENGLGEVMLVGDPDQAIFEWNTARPDLFIEKNEAWQDNSITLNENRRSSQNICDFTSHLSSLDEVSVSIDDDVTDHEHEPQILGHDGDYVRVIDEFINCCNDQNIALNPENVAVVCRANTTVKEIDCLLSGQDVEPAQVGIWDNMSTLARELCRGKFLIDNGAWQEGFKLIERAYYREKQGTRFCRGEDLDMLMETEGFANWRRLIYGIIQRLPATDRTLQAWINQANERLREYFDGERVLGTPARRVAELKVADAFDLGDQQLAQHELHLGTIHSVKGATFEAILVFLKKRAGQGRHYATLLRTGITIEGNEELRNVYVAISRPRRILFVAVPHEDMDLWLTRLGGQEET